LYRYFVSQSSEFCRYNHLCCFSTCVYCCCLFRYRLSPETLYNILTEFATHRKLVGLIKMCLNKIYSKVCTDKNLSHSIPIHSGLKQGDTDAYSSHGLLGYNTVDCCGMIPSYFTLKTESQWSYHITRRYHRPDFYFTEDALPQLLKGNVIYCRHTVSLGTLCIYLQRDAFATPSKHKHASLDRNTH
jgi:hypothetical protein